GRAREDAWRGVAAGRDAQAVEHVRDRLAAGERPHVPAERDALVQLHQLGMEEEGAELRLAGQHDAEQLLGRRLEVREEAELLQDVDREGLRLVDDDDRAPPRLALREEVDVERIDQLLSAARLGEETELAVDRLQQLERRERRVEDVSGRGLGAEAGQEGAQEGRLPGADVARDADEPARLAEPE